MSDLIIVDITENEKVHLNTNSELVDVVGNGKLIIKNPSKKSRLWNLNCDLKELVNTTIETRDIDVGILNPMQDYSQEYEIQNLKKSSLLATEIFDTNTKNNNQVNDTFLLNYENKCSLKIILENPLDITISNIKVNRNIPPFFQDIEVLTPSNGNAGLLEEAGSKFITWNIISLETKQKVELQVMCTVNPNETETKSLGELNITYLINNYKLTLINPEVRGLTDSMSGIDRDEGSQPGIWDCSVEFINESEFQIRLEDVKVSHKIPTGTEIVVSQTPGRLLNPEQSWDFGFKIEAKDVPELTSTIDFTPLYVVITRVIGEINKNSTVYDVLSAKIEKDINPIEVDAYANTDMQISNKILNDGTQNIEELILVDEIPADFIPPSLNDLKIEIEGIDISSRTEFTQKLELQPDDQDPNNSHKLLIELMKLSSNFEPNKMLLISYPFKARNPRPPTETKYLAPVQLKVNSPIQGEYYIIQPEIEPEIKVKYVARKLKTLKSIKPGLSEGEFSISVRIQNKGDVELENILIKEKLPKGFELTEININSYDVLEIEGYKVIQIKLQELKGNDSKTLNYNCSGKGDYPRYEPEVVVLGRKDSESLINTEGEKKVVEGEVTSISPEKKAIVNDLFIDIEKRVEETISAMDLGLYIESIRDKFPPGPVLHQFMQFSNDIKLKADKLIVGSLRDEVKAKLSEYRKKYT
jgi:hypothetical protein